jgi:hypothetical protein
MVTSKIVGWTTNPLIALYFAVKKILETMKMQMFGYMDYHLQIIVGKKVHWLAKIDLEEYFVKSIIFHNI